MNPEPSLLHMLFCFFGAAIVMFICAWRHPELPLIGLGICLVADLILGTIITIIYLPQIDLIWRLIITPAVLTAVLTIALKLNRRMPCNIFRFTALKHS